jgi:hypothetical protein
MGTKTGTVVNQEITTFKGAGPFRILDVELLGSVQKVIYFGDSGEDFAPVNGDRVIVADLGGGFKFALKTDSEIDPAVDPGERKIYSRDASGNIKAFLYLQDDGKIYLGDGTNELINKVVDGLTEFKSLVGASLLAGSVDLGGIASTGTNSLILGALGTMETAVGNIITALNNIKT